VKTQPDYYQVLDVAPDAPDAIIQSSYRTLMQRMRLHPDLGGDHEIAALINQAYSVLKNSQSRSEYDKLRQADEPIADAEPAHQPEREREPEPKPAAATRSYGAPSQTNVIRCQFCGSPCDLGPDFAKDAICATCASPLSPPERHISADGGPRALSRVTKHHPITFYLAWPASRPCSGQSQDISLNGMQFSTSQAASNGQILKIDSDIFRAVGRVAHAQHREEDSWTIGVEFLALRFENIQGTFVSDRA
jgi:curved DNA-binding protein CbpA